MTAMWRHRESDEQANSGDAAGVYDECANALQNLKHATGHSKIISDKVHKLLTDANQRAAMEFVQAGAQFVIN